MSATGIAAPNRVAADAAAAVASAGGNAVDAAIAATLVACVNEPGICGLGGGAYVTLWPRQGPPATIDGNVEMPGRGLPRDAFDRGCRSIHTAYGGGVTMTIGYGSIATPGALAAFGRAHDDLGRAPWREVLAPAIEVARDGFALGRASSYYLEYVHEDLYGWHPASHALLHDADGALIPTGGTVRIPELADALEHVAEEGWRTAYVGDLGKVIADDVRANDGILTRADLEAYRAEVRPSLVGEMAGWRLATNPRPAIGGVTLLAMLRLMDGFPTTTGGDAEHLGLDARSLRRLVEVQDAVLGFRVRRIDGAPDAQDQLALLLELSGRELEELTAIAGHRGESSPSTIHTSVVDGEGTACAITASNGYGSGVVVPGTGMWMNNCLGEHELNVAGVHALPVGTRLPSNMAPTTARHEDGRVLAIGSPGADRITTAILQTMTAMAGGVDLEAAIRAPRLHVQHVPVDPDEGAGGDVVAVVNHEEDLDLPDVAGRRTRRHPPTNMYFGGTGAVLREPGGGIRVGADPRRTGDTAVAG